MRIDLRGEDGTVPPAETEYTVCPIRLYSPFPFGSASSCLWPHFRCPQFSSVQLLICIVK